LLIEGQLYVLSFVGIGSAIGQTLEIPIILRSLADSLAQVSEDDLPIPLDPGFLALLDDDPHDKLDKSRVVGQYDCAWWSGRRPQDLSTVEVLSEKTLMRCLAFHREQLAKGQDVATPALPMLLTMPPAPGFAGASNAGAGQATICRTCVESRGLVSQMLQNLQDIHKYSTAMTTASEHQWKIDMRSASTFHILHQAVIAKETANPAPAPAPVPVQASTKTRASAVRLQAQTELNRLNSLPVASHKWTWGEQLTTREVLALHRTGTRPGRAPHSGYDISQEDGTESYESSLPPSHPSSPGVFEDLPADFAIKLPSNIHPLPEYFTNYRQLKFDPLSKIVEGTPAAPVHVEEGPVPANLADQWSSGSEGDESAPAPGNLADQWSSGSEGDESAPAPGNLADEWSSGSDGDESGPVPANLADEWSASEDQPGPTGADLADHWSSGSNDSNLDPLNLADKWSADSDDSAPAPVEFSTPPMPHRIYGPHGLTTPPVPPRVYGAKDFSYIHDLDDDLFGDD
jgi:hypothetical protein